MAGSSSVVRVAAVQMKMRWYDSAADFADTISRRTAQAKQQGAELVVFPEDVGLPLVGLGDMDIARRSSRSDQFAIRVILRHLPRLLATILHRWCSPRRGVLLLKAPQMRDAYFPAFSAAARQHQVTIVGGSLPLPPEDVHRGEVYNTGGIFGPDGALLGVTRKVNLIDLEAKALHLSSATPADVPVVVAPFGKFAAPICKDNWDAALIASLRQRGAEIICDPAANPGKWTPEEQASHREGLWSRCQELPVYGVQASGIGQWLDILFEGVSIVAAPRELTPDGSGYLAIAATCDEEEVLVADLDMAALRAYAARSGP